MATSHCNRRCAVCGTGGLAVVPALIRKMAWLRSGLRSSCFGRGRRDAQSHSLIAGGYRHAPLAFARSATPMQRLCAEVVPAKPVAAKLTAPRQECRGSAEPGAASPGKRKRGTSRERFGHPSQCGHSSTARCRLLACIVRLQRRVWEVRLFLCVATAAMNCSTAFVGRAVQASSSNRERCFAHRLSGFCLCLAPPSSMTMRPAGRLVRRVGGTRASLELFVRSGIRMFWWCCTERDVSQLTAASALSSPAAAGISLRPRGRRRPLAA